MNERIFITAGGSGHRLDAVKGIPKALAELPGGETVISRLLGQLPPELPVTVCSGYRQDILEETLPDYDIITTYNPDLNNGILTCIGQVLSEYDLDSYTFLLGDTIWHPKAMVEALEHRHDAPLVLYGNRPKAPCETYMFTISGIGRSEVKEILSRGKYSTPGKAPHPYFTVKNGTIWLLDRWMDVQGTWSSIKKRMKNTHPATDFDIDEQYHRVWLDFSRGVYDGR